MAYYRHCSYCGDRLDPGERCECREESEQKRKFWEKQLNISKKDGQVSFALTGKRV